MKLETLPRRRYTPQPTPIDYLGGLTKALGGPDLYIKRDDLTGLAGGGNKTRKLEFLRRRCAGARGRYADHGRRGAVQPLPPHPRRGQA